MIALCPNPFRDAGLIRTRECRTLLSAAGYGTCVCPVFTGADWLPPEDVEICTLREVLPQLSHVVVLGGDGTILAVVRELDGAEIPILGVNLGTKGFMTSMEPEELVEALAQAVSSARIPSMVVTMGSRGAVYATMDGQRGHCAARPVQVRDTSGAGDAFCSGVAIGLTYGKSLPEAADIGARLASSVITVTENVCPRFLPKELGLDIEVEE